MNDPIISRGICRGSFHLSIKPFVGFNFSYIGPILSCKFKAPQCQLCRAVERKNNIGLCALRRSEEHTSELQSLMRISYAVFCLKKKNTSNTLYNTSDCNDPNYK